MSKQASKAKATEATEAEHVPSKAEAKAEAERVAGLSVALPAGVSESDLTPEGLASLGRIGKAGLATYRVAVALSDWRQGLTLSESVKAHAARVAEAGAAHDPIGRATMHAARVAAETVPGGSGDALAVVMSAVAAGVSKATIVKHLRAGAPDAIVKASKAANTRKAKATSKARTEAAAARKAKATEAKAEALPDTRTEALALIASLADALPGMREAETDGASVAVALASLTEALDMIGADWRPIVAKIEAERAA